MIDPSDCSGQYLEVQINKTVKYCLFMADLLFGQKDWHGKMKLLSGILSSAPCYIHQKLLTSVTI